MITMVYAEYTPLFLLRTKIFLKLFFFEKIKFLKDFLKDFKRFVKVNFYKVSVGRTLLTPKRRRIQSRVIFQQFICFVIRDHSIGTC